MPDVVRGTPLRGPLLAPLLVWVALDALAVATAWVVASVVAGFDALAASGSSLAIVPIALAFLALAGACDPRLGRASDAGFAPGAATTALVPALHPTAATSAWRSARGAFGGTALILARIGVSSILGASRLASGVRAHDSVRG